MLAGGSGDGSGRETGIALDGRLPSRKELVQLSQLCFPRAAEVRLFCCARLFELRFLSCV